MKKLLILLFALVPSLAWGAGQCDRVPVAKDATSQCFDIFIEDSSATTGAGLAALAYNTGSLTAYYHRSSVATATAITLADMTVGTFTSSGFKQIDATNMPGLYQFCPPNAAFATAASNVTFVLKGAANMKPACLSVALDSAGDPDGTAQAGATGSITLASTASAVDSYYSQGYNTAVTILKGTGAGQTRCVSAYVGSTKVATVAQNWITAPDNTSQYVLFAAPSCYVEKIMGDMVVEPEGSIALKPALQYVVSVLAGRTTNGGFTFKTPNGNATRVTATVDTNKNRTAITLTPGS